MTTLSLGHPNRRPWLVAGAALACLLAVLHPATSLAAPPLTRAVCAAPGLPLAPVRMRMLQQLNAYRQNLGVAPVRYSKALELAADEHARDMAERGFFAHENPDGKRPAARALEAGFCHRFVGENISYGLNTRGTPEEAFQSWVDSPGHEKNLRHAGYGWVGMGWYRLERGGVVKTYWVQVFALE